MLALALVFSGAPAGLWILWAGVLLGVIWLAAVLRWSNRHPEPRWRWDELDLDAVEFPSEFEWGVATSAHQVEGGCTNNNWADWEQAVDAKGRPRIARGDKAGPACDHWNRYPQDVRLITELGVTKHRLSIEWSKIEPSEGQFDPAAIEHYHKVLETHRRAGIDVDVTLYHFTVPRWFEAKGAFTKTENVTDFVRFATRVFDEYKGAVSIWWTINEPEIVATMSYLAGMFPPGKRNVQLTGEVIANLLHAHTEAYHAIKACPGGDQARVGIVKNIFQMHPYRRWFLPDWLVARGADRLMNKRILEYLETGRFVLNLPGLVRLERHHPRGARAFDVLGLNYYSHLTLKVDPFGPEPVDAAIRKDEVATDMPFSMYPEGLHDALLRVAHLDVPVYVTENGIADARDDRREEWIRRYIYALSRAKKDGVDVRGFYYWSLMDNFEWSEGFAMRFGLYEVDYETQERKLRPSAKAFVDLVRRSRAGELQSED